MSKSLKQYAQEMAKLKTWSGKSRTKEPPAIPLSPPPQPLKALSRTDHPGQRSTSPGPGESMTYEPEDPFDGPDFGQYNPGGNVGPAQRARPKLTRQVLWRSANGRQVVVEGPFPEAFFRATTRKTPEAAAKCLVQEMYAHPAAEKGYAKVLAEDIVEVYGGENEFGIVSP